LEILYNPRDSLKPLYRNVVDDRVAFSGLRASRESRSWGDEARLGQQSVLITISLPTTLALKTKAPTSTIHTTAVLNEPIYSASLTTIPMHCVLRCCCAALDQSRLNQYYSTTLSTTRSQTRPLLLLSNLVFHIAGKRQNLTPTTMTNKLAKRARAAVVLEHVLYTHQSGRRITHYIAVTPHAASGRRRRRRDLVSEEHLRSLTTTLPWTSRRLPLPPPFVRRRHIVPCSSTTFVTLLFVALIFLMSVNLAFFG
jgi:hypothetical protein